MNVKRDGVVHGCLAGLSYCEKIRVTRDGMMYLWYAPDLGYQPVCMTDDPVDCMECIAAEVL